MDERKPRKTMKMKMTTHEQQAQTEMDVVKWLILNLLTISAPVSLPPRQAELLSRVDDQPGCFADIKSNADISVQDHERWQYHSHAVLGSN